MNGFLLIDKPEGISSFDVIRVFKRKFLTKQNPFKIGHAGTLDPFASGLLILLLGQATKFSSFIMNHRKTYRATLKLGATTPSLDPETSEISIDSSYKPHEILIDVLRAIELEFTAAPYLQMPPIYSALKVNGKRAYSLARQGSVPILTPKLKTIYRLEFLESQLGSLSFQAQVSSGTYIRSLGRDIAEKLNTLGYLTALRRVQIGSFELTTALTVETLKNTHSIDELTHHSGFQSLSQFLESAPAFQIENREDLEALKTGVHRVLQAYLKLVTDRWAELDTPQNGVIPWFALHCNGAIVGYALKGDLGFSFSFFSAS